MFRFLWTLFLTLALQAQPRTFSTPVTVDINGHWVLRVELGTKGLSQSFYRTFRFILDTGTTLCILDKSVAPEFFQTHWWRPNLKMADINGIEVKYPVVSIHRMKVGEITQTCVKAVVMDLKSGVLGSIEDEPVDGIVGMNFLVGRAFTWEPSTQSILWNDVPIDGIRLPIISDRAGLPTLKLSVDKASFLAILDTGAYDGFSIPSRVIKTDLKGTESWVSGLNGSSNIEKRVDLPKINAGPVEWERVKASLVTTREGNLGLSIFAHQKTGFDFRNHFFILLDGPDSRSLNPFEGYNDWSPIWLRKDGESYLQMPELAEGGPAYRAGLRRSDVVLCVNKLAGPRLNRRAIRDEVRKGPTTWVVLRNNKPLTLQLEAQPYPPRPQKALGREPS